MDMRSSNINHVLELPKHMGGQSLISMCLASSCAFGEVGGPLRCGGAANQPRAEDFVGEQVLAVHRPGRGHRHRLHLGLLPAPLARPRKGRSLEAGEGAVRHLPVRRRQGLGLWDVSV